MTQLELFELDDQLDEIIKLAKRAKKERNFFAVADLADATTRALDIVTNRPWSKAVKMGLQYAHAWCFPGIGGCGKNRVDHDDGKLCIREIYS